MSILKLYSAIFLAFVAVSCTQNPAPKEEATYDFYQELFLPDSGGIFRGINVADEPDMVEKKETETVIFSSDSLIQYQFNYIENTDTLKVDLYYAFDTFGLFEIQCDIYTLDKSIKEAWMNQLETGLTTQFGNHKTIGKTHRWTTPSPSNNVVEISLSEERDIDGIPFISLNILEPLENEL